MDLNFLSNYIVLIVVGICLCVGYIIKKWIKDIDNKYIPTAVAAVGVLVNIWLNGWTVTPVALLGGLFSALASTGLHQIFKELIEKGE